MIQVSEHLEGPVVPVLARPSARRTELLGVHDGALRIGVTAAPERGRANEAIAEFLANQLGVRPSDVELLTSPTSRSKRFLVRGLAATELADRIVRLVESAKVSATSDPNG